MDTSQVDELVQTGRILPFRSLCCYVNQMSGEECNDYAEWQIDGPGHDDITHSCTEHVGYMLSDAPCYVITPVKTIAVTTAEDAIRQMQEDLAKRNECKEH